MFSFFKKNKIIKSDEKNKRLISDNIEKSLWDIKEIYDFETEEIEKVVFEKRNFDLKRKEID
tara:strand:+ start:206 stop:391 length:186 start_codon:yes stop_codon:yes gene_type:complete